LGGEVDVDPSVSGGLVQGLERESQGGGEGDGKPRRLRPDEREFILASAGLSLSSRLQRLDEGIRDEVMESVIAEGPLSQQHMLGRLPVRQMGSLDREFILENVSAEASGS
jgi:hypothetical protein